LISQFARRLDAVMGGHPGANQGHTVLVLGRQRALDLKHRLRSSLLKFTKRL